MTVRTDYLDGRGNNLRPGMVGLHAEAGQFWIKYGLKSSVQTSSGAAQPVGLEGRNGKIRIQKWFIQRRE